MEGWWVLNSRILFIPSEQQADKPSAGSDASLSQAVLQSIGRGQLGLEDGSPQIRNQPGKTPTRTHSELQLCSPPAVEVEKPSLRLRDVYLLTPLSSQRNIGHRQNPSILSCLGPSAPVEARTALLSSFPVLWFFSRWFSVCPSSSCPVGSRLGLAS